MPTNWKMQQNKPSAIITGASSGLGRELAYQFAKNGINVILSGRNREELAKTQDQCVRSYFPPPMTIVAPGDLTDPEVIRTLASTADLQNVRYLVSCAAVYSKGLLTANTRPCDILLPNLVATMDLVKAVYPAIVRNGGGTVININSSAGKTAPEEEALYAASKHGLTGFFKSFRVEARRKKVRVLDVFIGGMRTPMMQTRPDFEYLIDPAQAAEVIYNTAVVQPDTLEIDELTISRFKFPA
jgi:short-subunit dehydrogenase